MDGYYSGALLNDCLVKQRNRYTMTAKRCFNRQNWLPDDRFPALGTDSLHYDVFKRADRRLQSGRPLCKMAPCCVFGRIPRYTGTENGRPYGGSSLDVEFFSPLERIERVFIVFQWDFLFHLTRVSLYSVFAGTDYPR